MPEDRGTVDALTCPISLSLFVDPVQTPCCGNTLSRASLRLALPRCPLCRVDVGEAHPHFDAGSAPTNRAVASLVDEHRKQHPQPPSHTCAECGQAGAKYRCTGCRKVHYCSAKCQHAAWPEHKGPCRALARAPPATPQTESVKHAAKRAAQAERQRTQRAAVGTGLASTRESAPAPAPASAGAEEEAPDSLLGAILDGLSRERLWVLTDAPAYERLLLVSRRAKGDGGPYQEHIVEAGFRAAAGSEAAAAGEAAAGEAHASCWWTMMDYGVHDLKAMGLGPCDEATARTQFGAALRLFDEAKRHGPPAAYAVRTDPTVLAGNEDAGGLVEQMLGDSSLRFILPAEAISRLEAKRVPDPKDVRRALDAITGVSLMPR